MAKETNLPDPLFIAEDKVYPIHVKDLEEDASVDITSFALSWMLKRKSTDLDAAALVTKTTSSGITISGTYNATPASNAQRARVTVLEADTTSLGPGVCYWELKRTDSGSNTVIAYGTLELKRGVHRA